MVKQMVFVGVLALSGSALAQSSVPGVVLSNGGWVPCDSPAAVGLCSSTLTVAPTAPTTLNECIAALPAGNTPLDQLKACGHLLGTRILGCENINAYAEPERAMTCANEAIARTPALKPRIFTLGGIYSRPYGERRILIIGKALGLNGAEVVTAQVVYPESERGKPYAFVNDGGIETQQWWPALNEGR